MGMLHIFNGDHAAEIWKKNGSKDEFIVWREIYIEGPLPETEDLEIFRSVRAEYLSHFTETAGIGKKRLCRFLTELDETVLKLPSSSALMLWFDACIFDQTILMRILWLLERRKEDMPELFLYCCPGNCLTEKDFLNSSEKIRLSETEVKNGAHAWELFLKKDGAGMIQLAASEELERLPAMRKALRRCAEEIPGEDGLTRTQKQILQIVSQGKSSFIEIFKGLDAFEEFPFLGDTACQRILDFLESEGILSRDGEFYTISPSPNSPQSISFED